jgi:hypothetical protein
MVSKSLLESAVMYSKMDPTWHYRAVWLSNHPKPQPTEGVAFRRRQR